MKKIAKHTALILLTVLLIISFIMMIRAVLVYAEQYNNIQIFESNYAEEEIRQMKKSLQINLWSAVLHYSVDIVLMACVTHLTFKSKIE